MAKLSKKVYYHEGPDGKMHPDLVKPEYGEWGAARLRYMKQYLPEELMELLPELRAEPLSEQAGSPRDGQIRVAGSTESEASWRDRGTERTRPDAVDRSDGQHSARSDADHRGNLHLLNSQTAAEPEKPAAVALNKCR